MKFIEYLRTLWLFHLFDIYVNEFIYLSLLFFDFFQCYAATKKVTSGLDMDDLDDLDQVTQVIGYHPQFHDHFLRTQNFIMKGDGPLPNDYRYYLAIIVSGIELE